MGLEGTEPIKTKAGGKNRDENTFRTILHSHLILHYHFQSTFLCFYLILIAIL